MDRFSAVVNRAEAHPHDFTLSRSAGPRGVHSMVGPSRFPAVPVVESLRLIEEPPPQLKLVKGFEPGQDHNGQSDGNLGCC